MPDVYATITTADPAVVDQVGTAMEVSAADPQHLAMIDSYLADLAASASPRARILEIGSGTGAISRAVARRLPQATIIGIDPSPPLVARATELSAHLRSISFRVADGAELPFDPEQFDAAILHRVLCHVPRPDRVLAEAFRVLQPDGKLVVFDGDYATITLATGADDPLTCCVSAFQAGYINDPWLVRRLPSLVRAAGFLPGRLPQPRGDPSRGSGLPAQRCRSSAPPHWPAPGGSVPTLPRRSKRRPAEGFGPTSSSDTSATPA